MPRKWKWSLVFLCVMQLIASFHAVAADSVKIADLPHLPPQALKMGIYAPPRHSSSPFDEVYKLAFRESLKIASFPSPANPAQQVDAVLESRFEGSERRESGWFAPTYTFRFIVYSPSGEPVHTWTVRDEAGSHINVLQNIAKNFLVDLDAEMEVAKPRLEAARNADRGARPPITVEALPEYRPEGGFSPTDWKILRSSGVIPIRVKIVNTTDHPLTVQPSYLILTQGERRLIPFGKVILIDQLYWAQMNWMRSGALHVRPKRNDAAKVDLGKLSLISIRLDPGESTEGLVYYSGFRPSPDRYPVHLDGWLVETDTGLTKPLRSEAFSVAGPIWRPRNMDESRGKCPSFEGGPGGGLAGAFLLTTIAPTLSSGKSSSEQSETSGCEKEKTADRDQEAEHFIASMGVSLTQQMAQGQGERLDVLASLLGCDLSVRKHFAGWLQARFDSLVPEEQSPPRKLLERIKDEIHENDHLAAACLGPSG